ALREIAGATLLFTEPAAARALGLSDPAEPAGRWILLDPTLRARAFWRLGDAAGALAALAQTPEPDAHAAVALHAPVLIVPRVFEPAFCRVLIDYYNKTGGTASGVTQENEDGKTVVAMAESFKRRADSLIA